MAGRAFNPRRRPGVSLTFTRPPALSVGTRGAVRGVCERAALMSQRSSGGRNDPAWSLAPLREPRYSQSLERGLALLGAFTARRPVRGIADLAEELGMSRSTTHRYAITLVALGYLEQGAGRKYRLGLRVTDLGMAALKSTGLREQAHAYLEELRQRVGYTVCLGVLDGTEILIVDRLRSFHPLQRRAEADLGLEVGFRLPAYCTAMGKLLLAYLSESEQREYLSSARLTRRGPGTITSKRALRSQLEQIRVDRVAVSEQEAGAGLIAIAVPVRDASEVVAALSLSAPASALSVDELVDGLVPHLRAMADRISARLGYRRDDEREVAES
jgi:DNA-binding IclR family transcriptional regulator